MGKRSFLVSLIVLLAAACISTRAFADETVFQEHSAEANLRALGIIDGDENGDFDPDRKVTRAEFAKMVIMALDDEESADSFTTTRFEDSKEHWAKGFIEAGCQHGFISGYDDNTFGPDDNVTYIQAVKMLNNAIGYTIMAINDGDYPDGYIKTAKKIGITNNCEITDINAEITRGQAAILIDNTIHIPVMVIDHWEWACINLGSEEGKIAGFDILDGKDGREYRTLLTGIQDLYTANGVIYTADLYTEKGN